MPEDQVLGTAEQLTALLVFLRRPAVQHQLVAFISTLGLAWILSDGLSDLLGGKPGERIRGAFHADHRPLIRAALTVLGRLLFPLLGLALAWAAQGLFRAWDRAGGLLGELVFLLWLIFVYRLLIALLSLALGPERVEPYRRRLIAPLFAVFAALRVLGLLIDLQTLGRLQLLTISETPIYVGALFTTGVVLYFLFTASWAGQRVLQHAILPRTAAEPGLANAVLTIVRYLVIIVGVSFALGALGFDTSTVAFVSGGLTVAIGFGSQQIFANLVSGVLLLFDQSLRPGDVISVAGEIGVVESLSIRATTMRTADNVAVVLPNQSFITSAIRNYSKNNEGVRLQVPITAACEGGVERVRDLALRTARRHPTVLERPEPEAYFTAFGKLPTGKDRVTLQLTAWLNDPLRMPEVTSDLVLALREALAEEGIELV